MALDNFTPEIWSAELLVNLHNTLVFGSPAVVNRDYEGEIRNFGDTVRINSIGGVTVSDYTKDTDMSARQVLSSSQMALVIDQAKKFDFEIDDIDAAQNLPRVMGAAMREAAFSLANTTDGFISSMINTAVPGASAGLGNWLGNKSRASTTDGTYEGLVDLSRLLDENNAPPQGRWVVVSPLVYAALLKDSRFVSFGTEVNRATIANRVVGTIAGFDVLVSNAVPTPGASPTVLAGSILAVTYAEQVSKVEAYRPHARFADAMKGLHLYGAKVVRPELTAKFVSVA